MTKLTNEELLQQTEVECRTEAGRNGPRLSELRAEILQRMAEGAAGEASELNRGMAIGSNYTANDVVFPTEVTFTNGRIVRLAYDEYEKKYFLIIDKASAPIESGSASTAGPRSRCPKCGYADGLPLYPPTEIQPNIEVACPHCGFSVMSKVDERGYVDLEAFAQFFAAAPAEDTKEK